MPIALFDYDVWAARFSELAASISPPLAASFFDEAGLYVSNADNSQIVDVGVRRTILNLVTAHIAATSIATASGSGLVGRIKQASEGTVSVTLDDFGNAVPAWWATSPYGLSAWMLLAPYRSFQYVPPEGIDGFGPDYNNNYFRPDRGAPWVI